MWKFLLAIAAVAGLVAFGNVSITIPHIPMALLVMPAIGIVFVAGLIYSQR